MIINRYFQNRFKLLQTSPKLKEGEDQKCQCKQTNKNKLMRQINLMAIVCSKTYRIDAIRRVEQISQSVSNKIWRAIFKVCSLLYYIAKKDVLVVAKVTTCTAYATKGDLDF